MEWYPKDIEKHASRCKTVVFKIYNVDLLFFVDSVVTWKPQILMYNELQMFNKNVCRL